MTKAANTNARTLALPTSLARPVQSGWFWMACIVVVFLCSSVWLLKFPVNWDVSFYLYAGERIAHGAVLYKDIGDMNPPLIYLLTVTCAWIADALHIRTHIVWDACLWAMFGVVLMLCQRLGRRFLSGASLYPLLLFAAVVFGILNRIHFGQRDQIVAFTFLPLLFSCVSRMSSIPPNRLATIIAACLAGAGIALKPYFVLPWLVLMIVMAASIGIRRTVKSPEFLAVATIQATLLAGVLWLCPQYLTVVRTALQYYSAYNQPLDLRRFLLASAALLLALVFAWRLKAHSARLVFAGSAAAFGFMMEAILQHKWGYQYIPFKFLSSLVIAATLLDMLQSQRWLRLTRVRLSVALWLVATVLVAYSVQIGLFSRYVNPRAPLQAAIKQLSQGRPILFLTADIQEFPMVYEDREILATRDPALWMVPGLYRDQVRFPSTSLHIGALRPPQDARYHLPSEMPGDEKLLFQEIRDALAKKPEVVYVETGGLGNLRFDFIQYFSTDPEIAMALRSYRPRMSSTPGECEKGDCVTVLVRQPGNS